MFISRVVNRGRSLFNGRVVPLCLLTGVLFGCAGMPPIVTASWSTSGGQSAPARRPHRRPPRPHPGTTPATAAAPARIAVVNDRDACGGDEFCAQRRQADRAAVRADNDHDRRMKIAIAVPQQNDAMRKLVASIVRDKAVLQAKGVSLTAFSATIGEPLTQPLCLQSPSLAFQKPATTCLDLPLKPDDVLEHPPLTSADSEFPGLPITMAEIRLSEADGGHWLEALLIGGYVVDFTWEVATRDHQQVESDLHAKYHVDAKNLSDTTCTNSYGIPVSKYHNLRWSFTGMEVNYEPVLQMCDADGVIGEGTVNIRLETYRHYLQAGQDRAQAKRPHI